MPSRNEQDMVFFVYWHFFYNTSINFLLPCRWWRWEEISKHFHVGIFRVYTHLFHKSLLDRVSCHIHVYFDQARSYDNNWHSLCDFPSYLLTITFSISRYLVQITTTSSPRPATPRHTPALLCAYASAEQVCRDITIDCQLWACLIDF